MALFLVFRNGSVFLQCGAGSQIGSGSCDGLVKSQFGS